MKVLIVVTSHEDLGKTGKKTGWYLPEVAHPYEVFTKAGYEVTFVSPKGGKAPMDAGSYEASLTDSCSMTFHKDKLSLLDNTKSPDQVKASDYQIIFYAGGHGPMFDLPDCKPIADLGAQIYERGGIVGAVCHGTVGLIPIKLSNGKLLLENQTVTSFTNAEEDAVELSSAMPFMLQTRLEECGAKFDGAKNFAANVKTSGRIVTGQNPASASPTAQAIVEAAKKLK